MAAKSKEATQTKGEVTVISQVVDSATQLLALEEITKPKIEEIVLGSKDLKINGPDDKEGYKAVSEYRKKVKKIRLAASKVIDAKVSEIRDVQKALTEFKKDFVAPLEEVEESLQKQEDSYKAEQERLERERSERIEREAREARQKMEAEIEAERRKLEEERAELEAERRKIEEERERLRQQQEKAAGVGSEQAPVEEPPGFETLRQASASQPMETGASGHQIEVPKSIKAVAEPTPQPEPAPEPESELPKSGMSIFHGAKKQHGILTQNVVVLGGGEWFIEDGNWEGLESIGFIPKDHLRSPIIIAFAHEQVRERVAERISGKKEK